MRDGEVGLMGLDKLVGVVQLDNFARNVPLLSTFEVSKNYSKEDLTTPGIIRRDRVRCNGVAGD